MGSFKSGLLLKFILWYLSISGHAALEPRCSKFAYEESLLEKMVRMEFAVEKMLEGVTEVKSSVKEELNKLKLEMENFEKERSEFGDKIRKLEEGVSNKLSELSNEVDSKLKDMQSGAIEKIENLTSETQSNFALLKNDVAENLKVSEDIITRLSLDFWDLKNGTIKDIIDSTKRPSIMFRARSLSDRSPEKNQRLVFNTVLENEGEGYNKDTGIFTAPVDGEYLFAVQLCSEDKSDFNFAFMEDGINKQPVQFENHGYGCGTAIYVTKVNVKSQIAIESKTSYGSGNRLYSDSYRWNVFSGILFN